MQDLALKKVSGRCESDMGMLRNKERCFSSNRSHVTKKNERSNIAENRFVAGEGKNTANSHADKVVNASIDQRASFFCHGYIMRGRVAIV